jgi:ligand-binding sensor domain-containing protein
VFISRDSGLTWRQINAGLDERDVFSLRQAENGALIAGTNQGVFVLPDPIRNPNAAWSPMNVVMIEKLAPKAVRKAGKLQMVSKPTYVRSTLNARVSDVNVGATKWYAATSMGLLQSSDRGATWKGGAIQGQQDFISVASYGQNVVAAARRALVVSFDDGLNWTSPRLPGFITVVRDVTFDSAGNIWIASREGLWVSKDSGESWQHIMDGVPAMDVLSVHADPDSKRMIAVGGVGAEMFESNDGGRRWHQVTHNGWSLRGVVPTHGRIFAFTRYDGVVTDGTVTPAISQSSVVTGSDQ